MVVKRLRLDDTTGILGLAIRTNQGTNALPDGSAE
jgi:hypothetical protein